MGNSSLKEVDIITMSNTTYTVLITGSPNDNSYGGKGYLGYVTQKNQSYFKINISDSDFNHYPVNVSWVLLGY